MYGSNFISMDMIFLPLAILIKFFVWWVPVLSEGLGARSSVTRSRWIFWNLQNFFQNYILYILANFFSLELVIILIHNLQNTFFRYTMGMIMEYLFACIILSNFEYKVRVEFINRSFVCIFIFLLFNKETLVEESALNL